MTAGVHRQAAGRGWLDCNSEPAGHKGGEGHTDPSNSARDGGQPRVLNPWKRKPNKRRRCPRLEGGPADEDKWSNGRAGQANWPAEVHHRHPRVGVVGSLSEKCLRGQLDKSPMEHRQCRVGARPPFTCRTSTGLTTTKESEALKGEAAKSKTHSHTHTHTQTNIHKHIFEEPCSTTYRKSR